MVSFHGRFSLKRRIGKLIGKLYQPGDFYVELVVPPSCNGVEYIRCFTITQLDAYLAQVDASPITTLLNRLDKEG